MSDEHMPLGLAAIARIAGNPAITVTSLRAAIAEGKLTPTRNGAGKAQVTLSDARLLLSKPPLEVRPKATPPTQKRRGVKLPHRRG